jgi:hypothetical protein
MDIVKLLTIAICVCALDKFLGFEIMVTICLITILSKLISFNDTE